MRGLSATGACLAFVAAAPIPTPIGRGPAYHPPARGPLAQASCLRTGLHAGFRIHLELFANRRVVIVPAGIGVRDVRTMRFGRIIAARCHARTWTLEPTGVIYVARRGLRLGDVFTVWGQPLGAQRLLGSRGRVLVFRNGVPQHGRLAQLELRAGDEIVLEVNGYVPPHRSYRFPPHP